MVDENPKCCAAIDRLIVGPDMRLYPCDAFKQVKAEQIVGTIDFSCARTTSLGECWEKSPFFEAVREYLTTPFASECASCHELERCLSGCLAQKVIAAGDMEKRPDPGCLKTGED
jgi:radical SAM protein with 4Fe4S-binding SPASM domain